MEGNPHSNHRERVRKLFRESGLDGFSDHNILELLLFYSIPKRDTNITAHNLINEFGSLKGVLDAPPQLLSRVKGVGIYTATYLSMISQVAKRYFCENSETDFKCTDKQAVSDYIKACFIGETSEVAFVLSFGTDGRFINCNKQTGSSAASLQISKREVLQAVIKNNAAYVILAHNHPGGVAAPSADDIAATKEISELLSSVEVKLRDHLIVSGNDLFSMESNPKLSILFL